MKKVDKIGPFRIDEEKNTVAVRKMESAGNPGSAGVGSGARAGRGIGKGRYGQDH